MNQPWYGQPAPVDWQALFQRLGQLEQQLQRSAERMDAMQKEITELKSKSPIHVEYHFDQLKVSRLEGTLNIGLTPQGVENVGELDVPVPGMWSVAPMPQDDSTQRIRGLQTEATEGIERQLPEYVQQLAEQLQVPMNETHLRAVIDDIKKQVKGRVHYYARTNPYPEQGTDEERANWTRSVMESTRQDVETAVVQYLRGLTNSGDQRTEGKG